MALALCLTLLPTAAWAAEAERTAQTPPAVGEAADPANGEEQQEDSAAKQAVATVQALIDALPAVDELDGMDDDDAMAVYEAFQAACEAYYDTLTEEQQAQLKNTEKLAALSDWFNAQVAPLENSGDISPDTVDAEGNIVRRTGWSRNGPIYEGSDGDADFTDDKFYVIEKDTSVTIQGNLTVGTEKGGLILCQGATLTVEGALICSGNYSIYGQSDGGANAGRLVVKNSLNENGGAAVRPADDATGTPTLHIDSGEVTINAGKSGKLVEGVELYSTNKIHAATLDAKKVLPAEWRGVSSIKGTSLVLEYCGHAEDDPEYVDYVEVDETQHRWQCKACGFEGGVEACFTNTTISGITPNDNGTHTCKCICGREKNENCSYVSLSTPEATPDGKGHTASMCSVCGSPDDKAEAHTYDADGKCTACTFEPLAKDEAGDLYGRTQDHSDVSLYVNDALAEGHTITLWRPDTIASKTIQGIYIDFDAAGKSATLDMNGYSLETSKSAPITVENGTLTVTGDATLVQNGTRELAASAVRVTGGTLIFEGNLTATGASGKPAVEVTNGTLRLKAGDVLNGGVSVEGSENYETVNALLGENLAFAKVGETSTIVNGNVKSISGDVTVVAHTHSIEEGQSACACGKQFEAGVTADGGTITYYETIDEAFANVKPNETVKLMIDSDDRSRSNTIYVVGGPYTFDLNGHRVGHRRGDDFNQAFLQVGDPEDGSPGTLTVLDSSKTDDTEGTGYFYELELYNGDLTVENGSFYRYWESANTATGTMTFKGGTVDVFTVTSKNVETKISGGTFGLVENNIGGKPGDLLADNRAFFNRNNDNFVNGYDDDYSAVRDVVVKNHTHNIVDGSCECGFTCAHDWSDKNGVCKKTNCGYHCPHNAGAAEAGGVWACNTCGQTVTAKVVAPGGTTTYYADGRLDNGNVKSGLYFAVQAAESESTVTMLGGGCMAGCFVRDGKTLTLDVSNGKTIDGTLNVGYTNPSDKGNKLIVIGGAELTYVIVDPGNTLDLTGWTGEKIWSLTVLNGGKATLNGGTFAKLYLDSAAAGSLLASGYAFQNADTGAYVECSSTANMENVKVVKCPHSGVKLKEDHTGAECKYCGASFAATLDDAPYGTIDEAISYWLANGGTLKLYADYTAADGTWRIGSGSHTINLNGHRMSVRGDGAFFKPTNNMHLTVTDGTELGQIENILLDGSQRGSFTLESGYVGNLKMTGGAVVALKGGSVDKLDVQNCSANTNLSIQGGSLGELNIKDWAEGMHVSATDGSLGAYSLPSGKILADVLDHQYYATGTSLDKHVDTAQRTEKFVIKQAPHDFGSTSKAADVPINGSIPFMVDSPSGDATGYYDVKWYRRTNSGAEHMTENKVAGVNVGDTLDVFCVITGMDSPGGAMKWQVAVKGYTLQTLPPSLENAEIKFADGGQERTFWPDPANHSVGKTEMSSSLGHYTVMLGGKTLTEGTDYRVTSGNVATGIGTYDLTIEGKEPNYSGTKTVQWKVVPHKLNGLWVTSCSKQYDGTVALPDEVFSERFGSANNYGQITLREGTDYVVTDARFDTPDASNENKVYRYTVELKNPNYVFKDGTKEQTWVYGVGVNATIKITKADAPAAREGALEAINNHADTYTVDLSALLPKLESPKKYGEVAYELDANMLESAYYAVGTAKIENGRLILPIRAVETKETGSIGSVKVKVSTTNYHDFTLTINVNAANKIVPTGAPTLSKTTLAWGEQLSTITLSGAMKDGDTEVKGTFAWTNSATTPSDMNDFEAEWKFTPENTDVYAEITDTVTIKVIKATPTGAPKYTAINASGKTLADAALAVNEAWPEGTVQWVDENGVELDVSAEVKANTAYRWRFVPTDTEHYNEASGAITLYAVSHGDGGGSSSGGSDSNPVIKTETKNNADGSTTKTETKKDGTVIETTTGKDGSVSKTETKPDGSSVTENKAADGSTGTVKTDKNGQTEAAVKVSGKAVEDAKKNGEAVKAPVEVKASRDSSTAPTVSIELPKGAGETKVEIPVSNVKSGTVAVLVHPDGTEEILKNSIPTEDGIQLTVDGNATVKIVDNSKGFIDIRDHWAEDAIDFVSARGLVNGMSDTIYAPNNSTTRAQLWTILARQNDANLNGGSVWYEKAQNWAKDKGVSDGANPNAAINRAQMVTMLWRAMEQPAAGGNASFADVPADSYYAQAVAWAVENGITAGVGGGHFDPNSTCTRGQIATFLYRYMK